MELIYFPEMYFVMQDFTHVSKNYLNFCLNYPGITNMPLISIYPKDTILVRRSIPLLARITCLP